MYSKTKLLEIYEKIKAHSEQNNNEELLVLANELHAEIQAMADSNTGDGDGGNSPDTPPDLP